MKSVAQLNDRIDSLKQQLKFLEEDKNVEEKDRLELRKYYEEKVQRYTETRDKIIENIPVDVEILDTSSE